VAGVPRDVHTVLSNPLARENVWAVIGTGNLNFGSAFCGAAELIARKLSVPLLAKVEVSGTSEDVDYIRTRIEEMQWEQVYSS